MFIYLTLIPFICFHILKLNLVVRWVVKCLIWIESLFQQVFILENHGEWWMLIWQADGDQNSRCKDVSFKGIWQQILKTKSLGPLSLEFSWSGYMGTAKVFPELLFRKLRGALERKLDVPSLCSPWWWTNLWKIQYFP